MHEFPSEEWFRQLQQAMDNDVEKYRRLGSIDLTLYLKINFDDGKAEVYKLVFAGYRCAEIKKVDAPDLGPGKDAAVVEGDYQTWKDMIEDIIANGGASLEQTLNYLTLPDVPMRVWSSGDEDQLDVDRFYRFNESLQQFFDAGANVETKFRA